jgi:hypothetical protein
VILRRSAIDSLPKLDKSGEHLSPPATKLGDGN